MVVACSPVCAGFAARQFWDYPALIGESWSFLMAGVRIALATGLALALLYEVRAQRLGQPTSRRAWDRALMAVTAVAFLAHFDFFEPNVRHAPFYHRGEFFHHYLGAKYSRELAYTRIYACTAVAEVELGRSTKVRGRKVRDLRDNLLKPASEIGVFSDRTGCKRRFTNTRWTEFVQDVSWFRSAMQDGYWRAVQTDFGFNASPVWIMTGKAFASLHRADNAFFEILSFADVALDLGMFALLYWAFGARVTAVGAAFWSANGTSDFHWVGGAFLRQDWLFLLVASICLLRKRRPHLAGASLMWASLLRIVPAVFFVGWAIGIVAWAIRHRRLHVEHRRLLVGSGIAFLILVPASVAVAGPDAYPEFFSRMSVYETTPFVDKMGLETVLVHDWAGRMRFMRDDTLDDPAQRWVSEWNARYRGLRVIRWGLVALILAWTVWTLRRINLLWISQVLALPLVMALASLPNYYYACFLISAVLVRLRSQLAPVILATSAGSQILWLSYYWLDDKYAALSWLFWIFCVILLTAISRPGRVCSGRGRGRTESCPHCKDTPVAPARRCPFASRSRLRVRGGSAGCMRPLSVTPPLAPADDAMIERVRGQVSRALGRK
jgi:hypothetical protein